MSEAKQILFARNLICICIDSCQDADYQGLLWHQYSDEPLVFDTVTEMLRIMDELMDEWDYPQRGLEQRSFTEENKHGGKRREASDELVIDKIQRTCGVRNIQNKRGKLSTFIVQVSFRQNATWQGNVVIAEKNEKHSFASALELIRIMEDSQK